MQEQARRHRTGLSGWGLSHLCCQLRGTLEHHGATVHCNPSRRPPPPPQTRLQTTILTNPLRLTRRQLSGASRSSRWGRRTGLTLPPWLPVAFLSSASQAGLSVGPNPLCACMAGLMSSTCRCNWQQHITVLPASLSFASARSLRSSHPGTPRRCRACCRWASCRLRRALRHAARPCLPVARRRCG